MDNRKLLGERQFKSGYQPTGREHAVQGTLGYAAAVCIAWGLKISTGVEMPLEVAIGVGSIINSYLGYRTSKRSQQR